MKIIVASTSDIKINAVKKIFAGEGIEIQGVSARSNVPEQPVENETLAGARGRASNAQIMQPDADLYIGIENGIFKLENGEYVDKAVICCLIKKEADYTEQLFYSGEVKFDKKFVDVARFRGFEKCTVAKIMFEQGVVKNELDPHLSLTGKSREDYLSEALAIAANELLPQPSNILTRVAILGVTAAALAGITFFMFKCEKAISPLNAPEPKL